MPKGKQLSLIDTLDQYIRITLNANECWLWTGAKRDKRKPELGYGVLHRKGKNYAAHRLVYELVRGSIPEGAVLDHLCRVPACVNPDHLEPVTMRVNTLRGISPLAKQAAKTHCIRGHEFTPENTYIPAKRPNSRYCNACRKIHSDARNERVKAARKK